MAMEDHRRNPAAEDRCVSVEGVVAREEDVRAPKRAVGVSSFEPRHRNGRDESRMPFKTGMYRSKTHWARIGIRPVRTCHLPRSDSSTNYIKAGHDAAWDTPIVVSDKKPQSNFFPMGAGVGVMPRRYCHGRCGECTFRTVPFTSNLCRKDLTRPSASPGSGATTRCINRKEVALFKCVIGARCQSGCSLQRRCRFSFRLDSSPMYSSAMPSPCGPVGIACPSAGCTLSPRSEIVEISLLWISESKDNVPSPELRFAKVVAFHPP